MKAEINNENKARFFALYWNQKIMTYPSGGLNGGKESIDMVGWLISSGDIHSYYLNLKPLSQISDEDGLKLYKIINPMGWINTDPKYIRTWLNTFYDEGHKTLPPLAIDFIRSIGVAFEWMGLSVDEMVEAGWIVLTTEL